MSTVAYLRVSSTSQSLDRQEELASAADESFRDQASGKDRERPGLAACLAYLRTGDRLRCWSVDRLGRSLSDLLGIVKELTDRGVVVEFVKEGLTFDPSSPDPYAKMQLGLLGTIAEFERDIIRARQEEGIALAKERGIYKGRKPKLTPDELRTARERRALGVPLSRLAQDFGIAKTTMADALAGVGVYGTGAYAA